MSDPDLTPSEEQVRRLLADARHDDPVPDDVVARLDRALADLQGESRRTPTPADAAPVDLAARRRRRTARNLLVAAAAVVVVGVGISRVDLSSQGDSDTASDSGAASAPQETAPDDEAGGDSLLVKRRPLVLTSEDFDQRVRLRAGLDAAQAPEAPSGAYDDFDDDAGALSKTIVWCNDPAWGTGQRIPVRYDGRRGVLVLRPASGGSRAADLYLCGETVPTRSTTVPAG